MAYKMRYYEEADVLTLIAAEEGRLSHLKELGDFVIHFGEKGTPLFLEILRTIKVLPIMVETFSKKRPSCTEFLARHNLVSDSQQLT